MRISGRTRTLILLAAWLGGLAIARPPEGNYHLLKKIPLSAAGSARDYFDYLTFDAATRRLYLSHGTDVKVVDADSGGVVGEVTGLRRCHGVALVPELGKGFITDGDSGTVAIFDLKTLKVTRQVKADHDADSIVYDPASKRIFSFNGDSKNATVIDPQAETVVATIPLGGGPEFAVADGQGTVYNNNEETSEVVVIDSRALTIKTRWTVKPAGAPTAVAMDRQHRRLFISGRNPQMLVVMDADNGKVIQSFPISSGADANVFDPDTGLVFSSTRDGMVHIFHEDTPDKFSVVQELKTEYGAKTMALDPKTHEIFLDTAEFGPPPAPTPEHPHPFRTVVPGTFHLLVFGP